MGVDALRQASNDTASPSADPLTLAAVWSSLIAVAEGTGTALKSMAFTPSIREGEDFSIGVFDARGRMLAQGNFAPGHLGSMPYTVEAFLRVRPLSQWRPGDALITNDPSIGAGHLSDVSMAVPVFHEDAVVAFVVGTCHHIDVGGGAPGSQEVEGVAELCQEGLNLPPVLLFDAGKPVDDIFRIVGANTRERKKVTSDFLAERNALEVHGVPRLRQLFAKYGTATMEACFDEILRRTEAAVREEIAKLPGGSYTYVNYIDDYGAGTPKVKIHVTVHVDGDEIIVDFAGSDLAVPAGVNSYLTYTRAYVFCALKCLLRADLPQNDGGLKPIHVTAPLGSYFNPAYGSACGARAINCVRIAETVMGALAPISKKAVAPYGGWSHFSFGGIDPRTGKPVVGVDFFMGGHGARSDKDALDFWIGPANISNIPVEIWEAAYPLRVESLQVVPDSEGVGRFRGSPGMRKEIRFLMDDFTLSNLTEKQKYIPAGLFGGGSGRAGSTVLSRDGHERKLEGKGTYPHLRHGDLIKVEVSGGAGYGSPLERDPERVREDVVLRRFVSVEGARRHYGVVIDPQTGEVDVRATASLRESLAASDPFREPVESRQADQGD